MNGLKLGLLGRNGLDPGLVRYGLVSLGLERNGLDPGLDMNGVDAGLGRKELEEGLEYGAEYESVVDEYPVYGGCPGWGGNAAWGAYPRCGRYPGVALKPGFGENPPGLREYPAVVGEYPRAWEYPGYPGLAPKRGYWGTAEPGYSIVPEGYLVVGNEWLDSTSGGMFIPLEESTFIPNPNPCASYPSGLSTSKGRSSRVISTSSSSSSPFPWRSSTYANPSCTRTGGISLS